jgi:HEAT repeat protein
MQLAARAIQRDPRNAAEFGALLGDSNEVIVYWAVQGLLMLKAGAAPAKGALQECFEKHASIPVRIAAAECLAFLGSAEAAVRYLGEVVGSSANSRVRLQAMNALTFIGEPARQALPAIKAAARDKETYIASTGRYLSLVLEGTYTPASQIYTGAAARQS